MGFLKLLEFSSIGGLLGLAFFQISCQEENSVGSFETTRFQLEMDFDKGSTATVIQTAEITLEPGTKIIEYELCSEHDISPSPMKSLYRRGRKIIHVDFV
jgi:hypothetical protein